MASEPETSVSAIGSNAQEADTSHPTEDTIRQQIRRQRRHRIRTARQRSKHKKRMRIFLIVIGQVFFLLLLMYVWFKVSTAAQ